MTICNTLAASAFILGSDPAIASGTHMIELWDLRSVRSQLGKLGLVWERNENQRPN